MTDLPDRIKSDIIDNTSDGITMKEILGSGIPHVRQLDISTCYFNVDGYGLLRGPIEESAASKSFKMRLLLGSEAILSPEGSFERYAAQYGSLHRDIQSINTSLDGMDLTPGSRDDTLGLIGLLRRPNVQVRLGSSRFNHSKCYILGNDSVFVGSSNFTRGGLVGNHELNAGLYQPGAVKQTRDWFDRMWEEATDTKDDLISVLLKSKFGTPPEPFDVYIKMLFERFKPLFAEVDADIEYGGSLTKFQQDAVRNGRFIISDFGGVIIADATGLGKTNMGIEIVRQKILKEGKKVLLVAPAQVLHSMWEEKLKDVDIQVREMLTMESLGRDSILDDLSKYKKIDFVLIDESQNFRSKGANRRKNLMKLMSVGRHKQAVLLTATPINNSLMDLYYQLCIITGGDDSYFYRTIGIPDLYRHMRNAANKEKLQQGLEKIQQLLDSVMVRRTRSYIKEVYSDDTINGEAIRFPEHEYSPIRYSLSDMFGNIFEKILDGIKSLTMAPYGIEQYNTGLSDEERSKHRVLGHLQVILLLKRFESSIEAVKTSLKNKITLYEYIGSILDEGSILKVSDFNRILSKWNSAEEEGDPDMDPDEDEKMGFFMGEIRNTEKQKITKNYDTEKLKDDMDADLRILRSLLDEVEKITIDTKLEEVEKRIFRDKALDSGGKKVLVFTEYTATARYITRDLKKKFRGKTVECITGGTRQETRKSCLRRFAPESNLAEGEELGQGEIDILVSTEVLSEGQNLQDCNYVINYDLPWNPMRIVQRIGRVDRLTSRHAVIHSRACYPDDELDAILKLVGKLIDKIGTVNEVVGLDAELLGETPTPRQFNGTVAERVRVLAGDDQADKIIEDMERESDIMPATSPINELARHIKEKGLDAMRDVPMGRRSGKGGEGQSAVLAYLQERPQRRVHFVTYDFKSGAARVPEDDFEAIRVASCSAGEPLHLPMDGPDNSESFRLLLQIDAKAREAIRMRNNQVLQYVRKSRRDRKKKHEKNITAIKSLITGEIMGGKMTADDGESVMEVIKSEYVRPWEDRLDDMLSEHSRSGDSASLVSGIKRLGSSIGIKEKKRSEETEEDDADPDLRLVGALFITGDKFDPDLSGISQGV